MRSPTRQAALVLLLLALCAAWPRAAHAEPPPAPRELRDLRFEERWHWLADGEQATDLHGEDFWDPVKHLAFTDDPETPLFLSLGGSLRLRGEAWSGYQFGGPPGSTATSNAIFGLAQLRLHTDWQLTRWLRVFAEARSAFATQRELYDGERPEDVDAIDLGNLFFDLVVPLDDARLPRDHLSLRVGRQELRLGSGRLVSPDPWTNTRRAFDGVRLFGDLGAFSLDAFAAMPVRTARVDFNRSGPEHALFAAQLGATVLDTPSAAVTLDAWWLLALDDQARFGGTVGEHQRHTIGGRLHSRLPTGFEIELEGGWQLGHHASRDIAAGFLAVDISRRFDLLEGLHVAFSLDLASGDSDPGDDKVTTFSAPYGGRHLALGASDTVGRPNIMSPAVRVALAPFEHLGLQVAGHAFYLAGSTDLLYDAAERPIRAPTPDGGRFVGLELDLGARYVFDEHSAAELGWSHVFAGSFIERDGHDIDFGYLQYQYAF